MAKQIVFSPTLANQIRQAIDMHAQELGDELDGVEEVVGDHLTGFSYEEWSHLVDIHGFDAVTQFVKKKFL